MPLETDLSERAPGTDDEPQSGDDLTTEVVAAAVEPGQMSQSEAEPGDPSSPVEVRRVRRVLRRIDPWSVLKVSLIFFVCMYGVVVVSALLVWRAAVSSGFVDDIEDFVVELGFKDFEFIPEQMFRALVVGGGAGIIVATFMAVLGAVLFNLISDLVGGVKLSMVEQQVVDRPSRRGR